MGLQVVNYSSLCESPKFVREQEQELPPSLCEELIVEILSWLPVKSLVRFRSVLKSWNSLISDSRFVKLHLQRSSFRVNADFFAHALLIVYADHYSHISSISSLLEIGSDSHTIVPQSSHIFIGACNGLISFRKYEYDKAERKHFSRVGFWNPAMRSMSQLSPPLPGTGGLSGFGYDSTSDTYKVVNVPSIKDTMVNVYNMGDNCWRRIQVSPIPRLRLIRQAVYVSNTVNSLATLHAKLMDTDPYKIVSFDLGKQKYAEFSLPHCAPHREKLNDFKPVLGVLRGCLCISENNKKTGNFEVWQMKEFGVHESWTQLFSINVPDRIINHYNFATCISDNGDALFWSFSHPSELVLYTLRDNKLEGTQFAKEIRGCYTENYIESLVSPY